MFVRYINIRTNEEKTAIGGMDRKDYLSIKDCVKNKKEHYTSQSIKEMQIIRNKFEPAY